MWRLTIYLVLGGLPIKLIAGVPSGGRLFNAHVVEMIAQYVLWLAVSIIALKQALASHWERLPGLPNNGQSAKTG
jgi:hypothetical protein